MPKETTETLHDEELEKLKQYKVYNQTTLAVDLLSIMTMLKRAETDDTVDLPKHFSDSSSLFGVMAKALEKIEIVDVDKTIEDMKLHTKT